MSTYRHVTLSFAEDILSARSKGHQYNVVAHTFKKCLQYMFY
jgi:hypothetical protein